MWPSLSYSFTSSSWLNYIQTEPKQYPRKTQYSCNSVFCKCSLASCLKAENLIPADRNLHCWELRGHRGIQSPQWSKGMDQAQVAADPAARCTGLYLISSYLLNCWWVRTKPSRRMGNLTSQLPTMFWILKSKNLAGKPSFCTTRAYFLAASLDCSSLKEETFIVISKQPSNHRIPGWLRLKGAQWAPGATSSSNNHMIDKKR